MLVSQTSSNLDKPRCQFNNLRELRRQRFFEPAPVFQRVSGCAPSSSNNGSGYLQLSVWSLGQEGSSATAILLTRLILPKMHLSARRRELAGLFVVRHTPARVFLIFDIRNSPTADELRPVLVVVALVDYGKS